MDKVLELTEQANEYNYEGKYEQALCLYTQAIELDNSYHDVIH
jgi:hypothetical protein